jgi:hypothetical protein
MKFLLPLITLVLLTSLSCGKKAVEIDFEWAKKWTYAYGSQYSLNIDFDGKAVFITKTGTYSGYARLKGNVLTIGRGKFIVLQHPTYFGPPLNRWSIEVDNLQLLRY